MEFEMLQKEVCRVIKTLEINTSDGTGPEKNTQIYLKRFLTAIESVQHESGDIRAADAACAELNQFWLDTVPWCSELSREIEKLIIMFGELRGSAE